MTRQAQSTLMTVAEVATYLRISRGSVYRLAKSRQIPVSNVGRQLRFRRDSLDHWLSVKEGH